MPKWVADAKAKKKKEDDAKKIAQSVVNKTVKVAKDTSKAVSGTKRQSSVSNRMTDAQYQKTYGRPRSTSTQRTPTVKREPAAKATTNTRLTAAQTQKMYGTTTPNIQSAEERRREREAKRKEREERRQEAQRQKMGLNSQATPAQREAANRAIRNTPELMKKAVKDAGSGYLQTLNDITERTASNENGTKAQAMKMGIEEGTKQYQELEENRKKTVEKARQDNQSLYQKMQQRQAAWDEKTKNAKGFEKAYYGAVESGTGMVADTAIGLLTGTGQVGALASMGLRTYGSSANQAKAEGATDAEAGWYGLGQAVKEMGTEMIGGGGLAKAAYGKGALSLGDIATNTLIRNLKGQTADLAHMGIRLFSDVAEENIEELAGWALDPWIKELTYGRNVRDREGQSAKSAMRERSDALRAEIQSEDDARAAAAYISSDDFVEQTKQQYIAAGMKEKEAEETAERMRDYLTASLTGDTDSMEKIEDDVYKKVAGSHSVWSDYSFRELKETFEATTLLVGATGLPGNLTTMNRGNLVKDQLGEEGVRALANTAIDFEDAQMSTKAKAMKARMDEGKELTGTQVYELQSGMQEQVRRDTEREQSSRSLAARTIESDNLLTPYRQNENGGLDLDEVTENTYRENANRAGAAIDALTKESKESITDTQKVDGSKAIAGFQTGVFTVDDANALNYSNTTVRAAFEAVTGVNLGQYIVRKKNGEVDIPATNTKTKDALFAMAADNLVKSAQAETANWMDNAKGQVVTQVSARMGARGSEVLQMALDGVDERDRSKYMMTANATDMLYQAARNMGTEWESISTEATRMFPGISESKLKSMYEAGLEDRDMANDKARGRQIRMGEALSEMGEQETATGKVYIDSEVPPKGSVIRTFTEIAKNLGADIHFVDYIYDANNDPIEGANGSYDPNTNTFYLNVSTGAETNIGYIFMHETTHYLKRFAPEQYQALENLVRERWFAFNPSQMQDAIARKIEAYKRVTKGQQVLTEEQALEEIIADASHDFINDPEFAKQVAEEDMGLAKAVLDSIRNALRKLRSIFASGGIDDDTHMNSLFRELDILTEAERLWLDAYKVAVRNSSLAAVNTWQENANEQASLSVAEDKWNNGEKLSEAKFRSFYSAHKLNLRGQDNLDEQIVDIKENGFRSSTALSNVMPVSTNDSSVMNWAKQRYGIRKGETALLVPKTYLDTKSDRVKDGFKPRDYEIVTAERDYQPYYELYSKAYDESIDNLDKTNKTVTGSNGEPVARFQEDGAVRFSISSYDAEGRQIYRSYLDKLVREGELSQKEADDMFRELETIYGISKNFADSGKYAPFTAWSDATVVRDSQGRPVFSAIKKNSEYKMNIDFSTICKKRRTLDAVFREMINRGMFEQLDLNKDESAALVVNINNLIRQHKFEAACALCFVEARRYRQQQTAKTFADMWNGLVESMYTDKSKIAYFNFGEDSTVQDVPDGIHTMADEDLDLTHIKEVANAKKNGKPVQTAEAKAARLILNDPEQRKLMRVGDMMASTGFENMQVNNPELMKVYNSKKGTGGAKSSFGDVQYLNEIIRSKTFDRLKAYDVSGVRIQSFSDYVPRMVFDYVQVIADLAAKRLPAHAYTKEVLFARQFGLTGAKINLSLVPDVVADGVAPGLDAKGNYIWNEEGTFPYDEAMKLQEAEGYKDNCGTIAVGISDEQIIKMLADPTIQMVIPYHKSSLNPIVAAMTNVDRFTDYTDFQNTKDAEGKAVKKDFAWDRKLFRLTHDAKGNLLPKEKWGNVQDLVQEYADWCKSKNYTPKFAQFLYMEDGSINPGYYKLLEDFALLDNDGNFKPQGDVQMRFPTADSAFGSMEDLIKQGLSEDTELEAKRSEEISGIVDEIEDMMQEGTLTEQSTTSEKLAQRLSITPEMDEEYMEAVNSGNMEEAGRLVDEAAQSAGLTLKVYHGTKSDEAFTKFIKPKDNDSRYDWGAGFVYVTPDEGYATEYSASYDWEEPDGFVMEGYINPDDFIDIGGVDYDAFEGWELPDYNDEKGMNEKASDDLKGVASAFGMTPYELMHALGERLFNDIKWNPYTYDVVNRPEFAQLVKDRGYKGIKLKEYFSDAYGLPEINQFKSADAVTYADDGSVIPLSQRFDPTNDDIRYSLPTQDADGNILSDGQMEYFKNSQARDSQGRLVPVYHTTNNAGFTIFDPDKADDARSLFFSDSYAVSQTYSEDAFVKAEEYYDSTPDHGYYECYLNLENPLIIEGKGQYWNYIVDGGSQIGEGANVAVRSSKYYEDLAQRRNDTIKSQGKLLGKTIEEYRESANEYTQKAKELSDSSMVELVINIGNGNELIHLNVPTDDSYDAQVAINEAFGFDEDDGFGADVAGELLDEVSYSPYSIYSGADLRTLVGEYGFNTRDWAEYADDEGYDGVIFRDIIDVGKNHLNSTEEVSTIYVAFNSNQVKDINNTEPTENPDIRYSLPEDQEVKDYVAQKADNISDIPLQDNVLEQNRQNHMSAAEAFESSIIGSWGQRTMNLEAKEKTPLKNQLMNFMKQVRRGSGTERQYKTETLDATSKSVENMYAHAKADNAQAFARDAWEAAERIVDDIDYNDDLYIKYEGLRDYFAKTNMAIPEDMVYDSDFAEFARDNYGRMRFFEEGENIEDVYNHLAKTYPELFPKDMENPIDMIIQMDYVLSYIEPYKDAYTSEQHAKLVEDIANNLCNIVSEGKEYRATLNELNVKAMKQRHEEAMNKVKLQRDKQAERADRWKERFQNRVQKDVADRKEKREKKEHKKHFTRILANYDTLCKWVLNPTKEKNVPEEFRKSLAELLQTLDLQTENSKQLEAKTGHVANKTFKMRELKDQLQELAERKGDDGTSIFEVDKNTAFLMKSLSTKLDGKSIDELDAVAIRDIDTVFTAIIQNIKRYKKVKTETKMAELSDIGGRAIEDLRKKIERDGMFKKKGTIQTINATALTPAYLFERLGALKEMYDVLRHNGFDTYIRNEKMIMDRMGEILSPFYKTNKKGQLLPGSEAEKWRDDRSAQTIELENGKTITMSAAQMMSLYCLTKRGMQAIGHMCVGGVVVTPIQIGSRIQAAKDRVKNKGQEESTEKRVLTINDIQNIISKLTDDQKKVADQLQSLMSNEMAQLGNEAHRELYGYEMFNEDNYFPIKVYGNERSTDINTIGEVVERIKSFGFTEPLTPNANKALEIDDIFSVVADHCNGMNLYNAYLVPITDFMKVLNYTHTFEDGEVLTMKEAIEQAYGKDMLKYILNLMKDINGIKGENRGGLEGIMNKALGRAKRTAVFGNVRVALQQPTAIVRAAAVINPKYIKGALSIDSAKGFVPTVETKTMQEMWEHCPIAQWKAWGYYDTYMGRDIEDVMMNKWSVGDKLLSGYYGQLDNASWSIIWQAVKAEQREAHPDMDHNSEEFLQICGRRASEVFDKTQVVDSTFHRSDAMRSNQIATKLFTAFMAEPTLTLNVFRAGLFNASEAKKAGNKGEAAKIIARSATVIVSQAVVVSAAQAIADAWRGKDPGLPWDDDDDEEKVGYWWRWIHNFTYNLFDQMHLENNMYLVKDVTPYINYMISQAADYGDWNPTLRAVMGWDQDYLYSQNNLVFAGLENTANGVAQLFKKLEKGDEYVDYKTKEPKKWYDIIQKIASGIGTFTGIPVGTLMRDFKPFIEKFLPAAYAADSSLMDSIANKMGYRPAQSDDESEPKDSFFARIGIGKTAEEKEQEAFEKKAQGIANKYSDLSGEAFDKKVWSSVSSYAKDENADKGFADMIAEGDYDTIDEYRELYVAAGGNTDYFDERIYATSKSAMKKTIVYDPTEAQIEAQDNIKNYLLTHGMSEGELSQMAYESFTARDMKVAFRINDKDAMLETLEPLVRAGLSYEDLERLWNNRNRIDIAKYKSGNGRYADRLKSTGTYNWPINGQITSNFGYRSSASTNGVGSTNHKGLDIGGNMGDPVAASDGGTVIYSGWDGGFGKCVRIEHDDGTITEYAHLSWWEAKKGDTVAQGQIIGNVGSTGNSTGPHLHFGVMKGGDYVDPLKYLASRS